MGKSVIIALIAGFSVTGYAQDEEKKYIYYGNRAYENETYDDAIDYYMDALDVSPLSYKANYNMAGALFRQKEFEKAGELYASIVDLAPTAYDRSLVYHNLGNCHLLNQKIDEAIDAYKEGLKLNPRDEDTRYNLAYALLLKKEQEKQQNQNQENQNQNQNNDKNQDKNSGENQDKQNQDKNNDKNQDKENQDKNEGENQDKENQDNNSDSQGDKQNQDKQNTKPGQPKISKEQAKRILDAALKREKEIQKNLERNKQVGTGEPSKKDW